MTHRYFPNAFRRFLAGSALSTLLLSTLGLAGQARAQDVTIFQQTLAAAASADPGVGAFYRANGYRPIWTGPSEIERTRRAALFDALERAPLHGLPTAGYDVDGLKSRMAAAGTMAEVAAVEAELSRLLVDFAADLQTGALEPGKVVSDIKREVPRRDPAEYLTQFSQMTPSGFFDALPPQTPEYRALMRQKLRFERDLAQGGWGARVNASKLEPGQSGEAVVALRDRLVRMGYLNRSLSRSYDSAIEKAVQAFQDDHGLTADGVAGAGTIKELNVSMADRLRSIVVAMERERWTNMPRGDRHVLVNLTDYTAKVIDGGKLTFESITVIGANKGDRRSPEFSDEMEHMVVNPSWYVPRSIITKEYLPALQRNPNAVRHLEITDSRGRKVNRGAVNFAAYSARSFPFSMRQPPSSRNALGLVKFMFPNPHNIYLHDTPQKALFKREVRTFSHGCIRLGQPFDMAYTLLALQSDDPEGEFKSILNTGRETKVVFDRKIPVHIIYRTAFADERGEIEYRRDMYGRDARIWDALAARGVALPDLQG